MKTRRSAMFGQPLEAITVTKVNRLKRLGAQWLQTNGVKVREIRFDMVGIVAPQFGVPAIEHIPGVG